MSQNTLPELLFVLPLIAITVELLIAQKNFRLVKIIRVILICSLLVLVIAIFLEKKATIIIYVGNWPAPYGVCLVFDSLNKLMLLVFSTVIACISIFSLQDSAIKHQYIRFHIGLWLIILGIIGALSTYDIFNLYVWFEVILVSVFILLNIYSADNTRKVYQYAVFNIIATLLMLLGIALVYGKTGNLNYAAIAKYMQDTRNTLLLPGLILFLLGLSIKGGLFPFYFWLPNSYPYTSHSSMLIISSLVTKVVMLVLLKLVWLWHPLQSILITNLFIFLSCCTMFFGVMGAANDIRVKNILSFHIISQLGYIILAIFIQTPLAIMAAIYFLIHNVFVKTNLLMTASIIEKQYKTNNLDMIGQITKQCPLLAGIFFISAMSLAGMPPLSGFWAKLFVFKAAFNQQHFVALFFAILVSLLTLYSMIKIWRYAYCEPANTQNNSHPFKLSIPQLSALLPLTLIPLLLGLFPDSLLPVLNNIANQLSHPQKIITSVLGEKL